MTWDEVDARLVAFRGYGDNWDGEGGERPIWEAIDAAREWVAFSRNCMRPPSCCYPDYAGRVRLEWHSPGRVRIEMWFGDVIDDEQ